MAQTMRSRRYSASCNFRTSRFDGWNDTTGPERSLAGCVHTFTPSIFFRPSISIAVSDRARSSIAFRPIFD